MCRTRSMRGWIWGCTEQDLGVQGLDLGIQGMCRAEFGSAWAGSGECTEQDLEAHRAGCGGAQSRIWRCTEQDLLTQEMHRAGSGVHRAGSGVHTAGSADTGDAQGRVWRCRALPPGESSELQIPAAPGGPSAGPADPHMTERGRAGPGWGSAIGCSRCWWWGTPRWARPRWCSATPTTASTGTTSPPWEVSPARPPGGSLGVPWGFQGVPGAFRGVPGGSRAFPGSGTAPVPSRGASRALPRPEPPGTHPSPPLVLPGLWVGDVG